MMAASSKENRKTEGGKENVLKIIYTFLIGIFLAAFVGVGIAAFHPGPKMPQEPVILKYCSSEIVKDAAKYAEFQAEAQKFDQEEKDFQEKIQRYNRDVSIVSLIASIIIVAASLTLFRTILLIADGLLLGGLLTLIYSVMRGFGTEDNVFRFIVVSVGLFISLLLGYLKFIRPSQK